jgi:hypothetical protein
MRNDIADRAALVPDGFAADVNLDKLKLLYCFVGISDA